MGHPHDGLKLAYALTLSGGPAIYLLGSSIYKKAVYGESPVSHIVGIALLLMFTPIALDLDLLVAGWFTTIVMLTVSLWESRIVRRTENASKQVPHA